MPTRSIRPSSTGCTPYPMRHWSSSSTFRPTSPATQSISSPLCARRCRGCSSGRRSGAALARPSAMLATISPKWTCSSGNCAPAVADADLCDPSACDAARLIGARETMGPERLPERLFAEPVGLLVLGHIGAEAHCLREVEFGQRLRVLAAALSAAQQRRQRHCLRLEDA